MKTSKFDSSKHELDIKNYIASIQEYDKLINQLSNEISSYNKKNGSFLDSINVTFKNNYFRFYQVAYLPMSKGKNNYYFRELSETNAGNYLKSNFMKKNAKLREMTSLLIICVRDRNRFAKLLSRLTSSIKRSKPKSYLIKNHLQRQLDI